MKPVPVHQAKTHLSRLIERACQGEEVVISRGRRPVVRLVPVTDRAPKREFRALRGQVRTDESLFEPLPDKEIEAWEN